jgi:hypothetical protein
VELSRRTVEDFERGTPIKGSSVERLSNALEAAGIEFREVGCVCKQPAEGTLPVENLTAENDK